MRLDRLKDVKRSRIFWYGFTTLIFAGLLYLTDLDKFLSALYSVKPAYMAAATATGLSMFLVWGIVWHWFFSETGIGSSFGKSLKMLFAGNFMNSVTPLGQFGGEPFMAYVISDNTESSYEKSLSTVISADIVNAFPMISLVVGGIIYLPFFTLKTNMILRTVSMMVIMLTLGAGTAYMLWFKGELLEKYLVSGLKRATSRMSEGEKYVDAIEKKIRNVRKSFQSIGKNPRLIFKSAAFSHLVLVAQFASLYLIISGIGLQPSFTAIYFTILISGLAIWSPTPGGSGTYEAAFSGLLMLFYPINLSLAFSIAVLYRIATFWSGFTVGYLALLSLRKGGNKK